MTLVSKNRCQSASVIESNGLGSKMPRLFTRMSVCRARVTKAATPSALDRSAAMPSTFAFGRMPARRDIEASTFFWLRPLITTVAPDAASPCAIAKPIPDVDPDTMACLPDKPMIMMPLVLAPARSPSHRTGCQAKDAALAWPGKLDLVAMPHARKQAESALSPDPFGPK